MSETGESRRAAAAAASERVQEPESTPPAENTAAWVQKYVAWASSVMSRQIKTESD
jgi:hypothetical protein